MKLASSRFPKAKQLPRRREKDEIDEGLRKPVNQLLTNTYNHQFEFSLMMPSRAVPSVAGVVVRFLDIRSCGKPSHELETASTEKNGGLFRHGHWQMRGSLVTLQNAIDQLRASMVQQRHELL